jgi:hypothetical protein
MSAPSHHPNVTPDTEDVYPDPPDIIRLLDGIPGAFERAQLGLEIARRGEVVSMEDL